MPLLTDAAFASFVELGRRGTGHPLNPKRVELKRKRGKRRGLHQAYFQCPGQNSGSRSQYARPSRDRS